MTTESACAAPDGQVKMGAAAAWVASASGVLCVPEGVHNHTWAHMSGFLNICWSHK